MHTPGAKAPFYWCPERPKAEALGYLEEKALPRQALPLWSATSPDVGVSPSRRKVCKVFEGDTLGVDLEWRRVLRSSLDRFDEV